MEHHRIVRVALDAGQAWPDTAAELGTRLDGALDGIELRVVALGETRGLVLLAGADDVEAGRTVLQLGGRRTSAVDAMNDDERLAHFVAAVVDADLVWGLYGDSWARAPSEDDTQVLPFWPTAELAARCIARAWESFAPRSIELDAFLEQWLTGMDEDGITAAITPTSTSPGAKVLASRLLGALNAAQPDDSP